MSADKGIVMHKVAAITAAISLLALGTVGTAVAQPTPSRIAVPDDTFPQPPQPGQLPANAPAVPDAAYTGKKDCIRAGNDGRTVEERPWGQLALQFDKVWRFATGKNQKVAVIDTGVNPHPRFGGRVEGGGDYVEQRKNGTEDCNGHGTLVAGIIAADASDSVEGFKGVAPEAKILAIRQSDPFFEVSDGPNGSSRTAGRIPTLAAAIRKAADDPAVSVINISETVCAPIGRLADDSGLRAAVRYAVRVQDKVIVAAAGNTGRGEQGSTCTANNEPGRARVVASPAYFDDDVLTVGAVQRDGSAAPFSIGGPWVDIAAPGTEITSLDPGRGATTLANRMLSSSGQVSLIEGTSFAAPYVAGVAALVRERFPRLNAYQVMERLQQTAQHPAGMGKYRDFYRGYGMVNPIAAVTAIIPAEQGVSSAPNEATSRTLTPIPTDNERSIATAAIGVGSSIALFLVALLLFRRKKQPTQAQNRQTQVP